MKLQPSSPLPLLADPDGYRANTIDMMNDGRARQYWLDVFEGNMPDLARRAVESEGDTEEAGRRVQEFVRRLTGVLRDVRENPAAHGEPSILMLCAMRQRLLREHGFEDAYRHVKREENETALALLPAVLDELDRLDEADRPMTLIRNIFAGNIFDLGCSGTIELYDSGRCDFHATRSGLPDRPWLVDDLDALSRRLAGDPHRKAVLFVDNAGADVVLGMIPFARFLLQRGADVILTANTYPALNDITHGELVELIGRIAELDPVLRKARDDGRLALVPSGNGLPVIDLSRVSGELTAAAEGADLLVIEGMGRSLETNYNTPFTCDTLKLAMVKEQDVADLLGGKLYDVVCRFEPA